MVIVLGVHFYPLTEKFGGYIDEPGVRPFRVHFVT